MSYVKKPCLAVAEVVIAHSVAFDPRIDRWRKLAPSAAKNLSSNQKNLSVKVSAKRSVFPQSEIGYYLETFNEF